MSFSDSAPSIVAICDWRGNIQAISCVDSQELVGTVLAESVADQSREEFVQSFAAVIASRAMAEFLIYDRQNHLFNVSMWPLESPNTAIAAVFHRIPDCVSELSKRELSYLKLAANGYTPSQIAEQLGVNQNTVHVQFRSIREKLKLDSNNQLICFAARYFHTNC